MADFIIGTSDPSLTRDPGSGPWGAQKWTFGGAATKAAILKILPHASLAIGMDAAAHMTHYLGNSGADLTIRLERMVNEVPSAKAVYESVLSQAKSFVEKLPVGFHAITSTRTWPGYNRKSESTNWYFAIGGHSVWIKGNAIVETRPDGKRGYMFDYEYKFFDRYNWDGGKSVTIFGVKITDEFMGQLHKEGLAQEFDCYGSMKKLVKWGDFTIVSIGPAPGGR